MMVNSDDEHVYSMDRSFNYSDDESMCYQNPRPSLAESVDEVIVARSVQKKEISPYDFPNSTFLNHPARSVTESSNIAQKCAISAACDEDTIASLEDTLPSQLESIINSLGENEAEKLKQQLIKENMSQWDSGSIYKGLGVDESGNFHGLSLIRLNDLLCNVNEHLLIMRRDIIQYGQAISQSREKGTLDSLGFSNQGNRRQLKRICNSITQANHELAVHVEYLMDYIEGKEEKSAKSSLFGTLLVSAGIALAGGALMLGFYHAKQNLKLI